MQVTQQVELSNCAFGEVVAIAHTQPHKTISVRLIGGRVVDVLENKVRCIVADVRPDLIRWESRLQRRALHVAMTGGLPHRIVAGGAK